MIENKRFSIVIRFFAIALIFLFLPANVFSKEVVIKTEPENTVSEKKKIKSPPKDHKHIIYGSLTIATNFLLITGSGFTISYLNGQMSDQQRNCWVGTLMAVNPSIGILLGRYFFPKSKHYEYPLGGLFWGGYLGSTLAFAGSLFYSLSDNPQIDGKYDGGYFDNNHQFLRGLGRFTFHYLLPIILPGIGMMFGAKISRKQKNSNNYVSFIPVPMMFSYLDKQNKKRTALGANLVNLTF